MSKSYYLPRTDEEKALWLSNFAAKINTVSAKYGITTDEVKDVTDCAAYFDALIKAKQQFITFQTALTAYKNAMKDGLPTDINVLTVPEVPVLTLPAAPAFDIFGRISALAARIKGNYLYTETDGRNLGIVGSEHAAPNLNTLKPQLLIQTKHGGQPEIVWSKQGMTGIEILVDRGDGKGWQFLAFDTIPNYTDTATLPVAGQTARWSYKAIYHLNDEPVGQWSDVASVAV